jgi:cell wall-associated NlpC family hydrolase
MDDLSVPYPADIRPLPSLRSRLQFGHFAGRYWRALLVSFAVLAATLTPLGEFGAPPASAAQYSAARSASTAWHAAYAASKQKGKNYVYGGAGPNVFDCSGLVQYSYRWAGVRIPRTAQQQYNASWHMGINRLRVGDIVFFHDSHGRVYHDAIYAGFGAVWNAPHTGAQVRLQPVWTNQIYFGRFA